MHFWIDKRSQGCGFSGRHWMSPSLSGYGHQRFLCSGFCPKPMVTPVHRFQSIESVANNSLRYARSSGYHPRIPTHAQSSVYYNASTSNTRNNAQVHQPLEMISAGQIHTSTPRQNNVPTAKLKCGVWVFFAIVTFFLAGAKYYFHGVNIGMEAFAFCSLLVIILIIGGLVSLYEAITATANIPHGEAVAIAPIIEQQEEDTHNNQVASAVVPPSSVELPPPPYHIAIMLPSQNDTESMQVIRDSPPPSYEKVVT